MWYRKQLKKIARNVELIAHEYREETNPEVMASVIQQRLFSYSAALENWAVSVAETMLKRSAQADYDVWLKVGKDISRETRKKLKDVAVGPVYSQLQNEQVRLIQSIPIEAARKVQEWTTSGLSKGERYSTIAKRIQSEIGEVSRTKAVLIARTETARSRSNFTEARARAIGSTGYIWHTVGDASVRPMHAALNGTVQSWSNPPECDIGRGGIPIRAHAGQVFNCRCWCEPLFPISEYEK